MCTYSSEYSLPTEPIRHYSLLGNAFRINWGHTTHLHVEISLIIDGCDELSVASVIALHFDACLLPNFDCLVFWIHNERNCINTF